LILRWITAVFAQQVHSDRLMATPAKKPDSEVKRERGRPSKLTDTLLDEIKARLADGEPLMVICRDEHMPSDTTVRNWMAADEAFSCDIARSRMLGWDMIAHKVRQTARGLGDSKQDVQRDKLIIDTDLKLLAKWDSGRYGEKITTELTGKDGGAVEFSTMTPESLEEKIRELSAKLGIAG